MYDIIVSWISAQGNLCITCDFGLHAGLGYRLPGIYMEAATLTSRSVVHGHLGAGTCPGHYGIHYGIYVS